jgi:glycosyltransferase involved in cell wall biosynthesis
MAARRDDVELVLAGAPGDDSEAVERSLAGLTDATAGRVRRLGAIDDAAKHWLMRRAAVLAYPSLDEGFGFPILEAQLAATPVVASDVGAVAEIAGDGAVLVAGRDPAEFAAALDRTLDDGTLRLGLIEAGHRNVRRYSWEHTGARLAALYRRVAADR